MAGQVRVGISGWRYPAWRGDFYPTGLPQRRELEYAAEHLTSIEINGSFYSLQRPTSYAAWRASVPGRLRVLGQGPALRHPPEAAQGRQRSRSRTSSLRDYSPSGPTLGPILWQLPENFRFDADVLDDVPGRAAAVRRPTAAELARRHDDKVPDDRALTTADEERPLHHALEFRSPTFATPEATAVLRRHDVATVLADTAGRWPRVDEDTGPLRYVRLHGDKELYASGYTDRALDEWAARCRGWADAGQDVFVYFDNDMKGYAPHDAMRLIARF